ncbi:translational machinery component [Hypoxylon sp. NC1633]|nr:translational machinery component [Hypoxylon sp. NC1633]
MSRSSSRLLAATRPISIFSQSSGQHIRPFSQTCRRQAGEGAPTSLLDRIKPTSQSSQPTDPPRSSDEESSMSQLHQILAQKTMAKVRNQPTPGEEILDDGDDARATWGPADEPFHFHIYAHKHNAHVTVTKPNRSAIISMSSGNIGFKKSKRGSYDAAYQLTAFVVDKLHQGNWHKNIDKMEVVLRGFGQGREAATKVLLGSEGRLLRDKIVKVSDATRLKFGGTRSPKPRRLG